MIATGLFGAFLGALLVTAIVVAGGYWLYKAAWAAWRKAHRVGK